MHSDPNTRGNRVQRQKSRSHPSPHSRGATDKNQSSEEDKGTKKDFGISSSTGPLGRINQLIQESFFKEKRTIQDIKSKLEEKAIFYDATSLSPTLLRLVKKGIIRRIKENGQWRYVNP